MRVRYQAERHPSESVHGGGKNHLTDGREYDVIEVLIEARGSQHVALLRLTSDDGTPALFDGRGFEVVDPLVPATWQVELGESHTAWGPPEVLVPGFWEALYDRVPDAETTFQRIVHAG